MDANASRSGPLLHRYKRFVFCLCQSALSASGRKCGTSAPVAGGDLSSRL